MSSVKKPGRRRQKKEIIDDEDLNNQEQIERNNEEAKNKLNDINQNMFETAKLDKNYFLRHQEKHHLHQNQPSHFQEEDNQSLQQVNNNTNLEAPSQQVQQQETAFQIKQKKTDKKKRRKPKNHNIFQSDEQTNQQSAFGQNTAQTNTQHKLIQRVSGQDYPRQDTMKRQLFASSKKERNTQQQNQNIFEEDQNPKSTNNNNKKTNAQIAQPEKSKQKSQSKRKKQQPQEQDNFDKIIQKREEQKEDPQQDQRVFYLHKEINKLEKQDRKAFYFETLPENTVAYAYFKRFSSGLSEVYQLSGEDHRPLLFCENQRGCIGCNYYISMTKEMDKNKPSYLGKLRGNAAGSTYFLYDDGVQPKNEIDRSKWRVTMAAVQYENNFMGMNGPRKLKVTTPSARLLQDADTFKLSQDESLTNFKPPIVSEYRNKTPRWNQKLKSYALNFGGRVKLASIKNFILIGNQFDVQDEEESDNMIVFGKVDQNTFSVQYRHPLSLFQAFGIVMSEFDFKINCE